jgi:release factor glutamine methyltransferase
LLATEEWLERPLHILDVGTGSGCLLLTLLAELSHGSGIGIDRSAAALAVARANAQRLGVDGRARWLVADLLEAVQAPFDVLIANPPYIRTTEIPQLEPEVRCFDPHLALDGGRDGLRCFRQLVAGIERIVPDGWVVLEVGHDQADAVAALLAGRGSTAGIGSVKFFRDLAGRRRCVAARTRK